MNKLVFYILQIGLVLINWTSPIKAHGEGKVFLKVGQAQVKKSLLAFTPFQFYGSATKAKHIKAGQNLYNIAYNDLNVSGLFKFILPSAYLEDVNKVGLKPAPGTPGGFNFSKWKTIGTEFLVRGGYRVLNGKLSLEIYLYYVPQATLVFGKTYQGSTKAIRKIAHTFASDVLEKLTGRKGMFHSKIVVSRKLRAGKSVSAEAHKEIYVMDWDGANPKKITNHKSVATSPSWSIDGKKVAYTAYAYHKKSRTRNADLFTYELATGKRWLVSYRKGINSGSNFLPDNKNMLLTLSQAGSPDIFRMSIDGRTIKRITRGPNRAMNVEPAISPDGKTIAFSSDRSGKPMLYTMTAGGTRVKRLTYTGRYNSTPSWSPDGKTIAYAGFGKETPNFDLFIINKNGTGILRLTRAYKKNGKRANNEEPTFSPDGRHIMFVSDRTGSRQLYIINPDGKNERRITHDTFDYFKPKWSPHLP